MRARIMRNEKKTCPALRCTVTRRLFYFKVYYYFVIVKVTKHERLRIIL